MSRKLELSARGYMRPEADKFRASSSRAVGNVGAKMAQIKDIEEKINQFENFNEWADMRGGHENISNDAYHRAQSRYFAQTEQ